MNVILHRLVEGKIVNDPYPHQETVPLNNIGLDFIVKFRDERKLTKPLYDETTEYYGAKDGYEQMVIKLAQNLRAFGGDVLKGDFAVFVDAGKLMKAHHKRL